MDHSAKLEKNSGLPEVDTIRTVHQVYRELQQGTSRSFVDAAKKLGANPNSLHRRIERFEAAIRRRTSDDSFQLFNRERGKRAEVVEEQYVTQLMHDIAEFLDAYDRIISKQPRRLTIRIGASLVVCNYLAPKLLHDGSLADVAFEFGHAKPLQLRSSLQQGEFDLVLTTVSDEFKLDMEHVLAHVRLPMALVFPRGHWAETRGSFDWPQLGEHDDQMVLLREEPDRYPMPKYPIDKLPESLTIHRLSSASLCHAMVMERRAVTICLPQFFTSRQRELVHVVSNEDIESVQVALLAPKQSLKMSPAKRERLAAVGDKLKEELNALTDPRLLHMRSQQMHMYHVTRMEAVRWLHGTLVWRVDARDISGFYTLPAPNDPSRHHEFLVRGHLTYNELDSYCHVACRAIALDETDEFVLNLTCRTPDLIDVEMVGVWAGRPAWHPSNPFAPFVGSVVVCRHEKSAADLNRIVEAYCRDNNLTLTTLPVPN